MLHSAGRRFGRFVLLTVLFHIFFLNSEGVYDTVCECKTGDVLVLRIDCRTDPILVTLFGCQAQHPLIDSDMHIRIAYHDGKLLGAAVMETIVQLQLHPPKILRFTDDEVKAIQPPPVVRERRRRYPEYQLNPVEDPADSSLTTSPSSHWVRFKDQAQTVVEMGANTTPSDVVADSVIWAEAQIVEDRMDTTASNDPSGTYYANDVATFSITS